MTTNQEVELTLAPRIDDVLRQCGILSNGYSCQVHLYRGNRKKRVDAGFEANWNPDTDSFMVEFLPIAKRNKEEAVTPATRAASAEDRLPDLLKALDRAERRPGYEFISLKWFRDTALVHEGLDWAADEFSRHDLLREAIDRRWILTSKVPNPRPPNFPVTAIRLNRRMPEVDAVLGENAGSLPTFRPCAVRGEPLSSTLLRDRR